MKVDVTPYRKAGEPEHVAREAELLAAARHPGIVALIGIEGDPLQPVLVTRRVAGQPLSEASTLSRAEIAGVAAAVASTLADLHQLGFVHGAVAAEHVILGPGGRPVLCSLGYGGRVGECSPDRPILPEGFAPPDHRGGDPLDPSIDVYGAGALLRALLGESAHSRSEPLFRLAEQATVPDVARRPTASRLAAAINEAVPDATLPGIFAAGGANSLSVPRPNPLEELRRAHAPSKSRRRIQPRLVKMGAVAVAGTTAVVVLAANALSAPGRPAPPVRDPLVPSAAPTTLPDAPATTTPAVVSTVTRSTTCPPVAGSLAADTDGDGCAEPLQYGGGVLQAGPVRWSVGEEGDQVVTGDWACDGTSLLALLHPPTGDVFVFDRWAALDQDVVAAAVARVEGGFALRSGEVNGGCQRLVVDRRDGPPVIVPVRGGE